MASPIVKVGYQQTDHRHQYWIFSKFKDMSRERIRWICRGWALLFRGGYGDVVLENIS